MVGGWVRDYLMGHPYHTNYDIEVFGLDLDPLKILLKSFGPVHMVGRHFGVLKLSTREAEYDISIPRRDKKTAKGHKGFQVDTDPALSFEGAASRRDFTINSMGYAFLEETFLDPFEGMKDLQAGLLRHVGPAFGEDPLRVMRAMQFAGRFGLEIVPETLAICREQDLQELPRERMWEEFKKLLLLSPTPSSGFKFAAPLGVLPYFPELEALKNQPESAEGSPWDLGMAVLDAAAGIRAGNQEEELALMFAALCINLQSPGIKGRHSSQPVGGEKADNPAFTFLARLTNETRLTKAVITLVNEAAMPDRLFAAHQESAPTDGELRRLALRTPIIALERLARARFLSRLNLSSPGDFAGDREKPGREAYPAGQWLLERAETLNVLEGPPQPILKGKHLQELGVLPGKAMGKILDEAFDLQLDGVIVSLEDALAWARERVNRDPGPTGTP